MVQKGQFSAFAFMAKTLSPSLPQIVFWGEIKVQPLIHWEKSIGGLHELVFMRLFDLKKKLKIWPIWCKMVRLTA